MGEHQPPQGLRCVLQGRAADHVNARMKFSWILVDFLKPRENFVFKLLQQLVVIKAAEKSFQNYMYNDVIVLSLF